MNLDTLLKQFHESPLMGERITAWREIPAQAAVNAPFPDGLHPLLVGALRERGINQLYSHQVAAWDAVKAGQHVAVVTPTASGKTLCYNLPVLDEVLREPTTRALYLFPTKALAQDQLAGLHQLITTLGQEIKTYTYDGDTPGDARKLIRSAGHIVITNPDMLHTGILPHHTKWVRLFENLKYIVVDELHHYRGVFGSHVANVLRRLERICAFYGATPQFICCSATIANPGELAARLIGVEPERVTLVDKSGAPRAAKHFIMYNPPVINRELGLRRSTIAESSDLATRFLANDVQTIVFARARTSVEVLLTYLRNAAKGRLPERAIRGYRGGYLPLQRREIERGLRDGSVRLVVSTNALELGIDIGTLEVCIMAGYPGTIASAWQQAGRAGRQASTAAAIMVAGSSPLDQYIINHPDYFFGKPPENGLINPDNLLIEISHLKCAAFELPFSAGEHYGNTDPHELLDYLEEVGILHSSAGTYHWMSENFPAAAISLRTAAADNFVIVDTSEAGSPRIIGEIDRFSVPTTVHEDAIYLHDAQQYHVDKLDWDEQKAYVRAVDVDYYTDADLAVTLKVLDVLSATEPPLAPPVSGGEYELPSQREGQGEGVGSITLVESSSTIPRNVEAARWPSDVARAAESDYRPELGADQVASPSALPRGNAPRNHGEVMVSALATIYKKIKLGTHENVGWGKISLPEQQMHTTAYWLTVPDAAVANLGKDDLQAGLLGLANVMSTLSPLYLMCDPRDLGCEPQVKSPFTKKPTIFIYDSYPGGIGFSQRLYDLHAELLRAAADLITVCDCEAGCPSCVGPAVEVGSDAKGATLRLLAGM